MGDSISMERMKGQQKFAIALVVLLPLIILFYPVSRAEGQFIIEDNRVYIDDSRAYISVTPHTITKSNEYIYINLTSKQYTGDIDIVLGFNTTQARPSKAELHITPYTYFYNLGQYEYFGNVTLVETTENPCEMGFEYNKIKRYVEYADGNKTLCFDYYEQDDDDYIIYWNETMNKTIEWNDISDRFDWIDYDFGGMNKWFYYKNIPVNAGDSYLGRVLVNVPIYTDGKYWLAIKPSGETIHEAITNNHFYYIDPYWSTAAINLTQDLVAYWSFDNDDLDNIHNPGYMTMVETNIDYITGHNGTAVDFDGGQEGGSNSSAIFPYRDDHTVCSWINLSAMDAGTFWQISPNSLYGITWIGTLAEGGSDNAFSAGTYSSGWQVATESETRTTNTWYFVCHVIDSDASMVRLYVNGVNTANQSISTNTDTKHWGIGDSHTSARAIDGLMDDVTYFDVTLSPINITDLYNQGGIPYPWRSDKVSIEFVSPTDDNAAEITDRDFTYINMSITNLTSIDYVTLHFNGTNYTIPSENFLAYNETDPDSEITIVSNKITVANFAENKHAHVFMDMGFDYFDGNFRHKFIAYMDTDGQDWSEFNVWAVANMTGSYKEVLDANGSILALELTKRSTNPNSDFTLHEEFEGITDTDTYGTGNHSAEYYIEIFRNESVGVNGTLYCYICLDDYYSDGGSLFDTLIITLHGKQDYRYLYGAQGFIGTGGATYNGYSRDLDIGLTSGEWYLNLSGLDDGTYSYYASVEDAHDMKNATETRTITFGEGGEPPADTCTPATNWIIQHNCTLNYTESSVDNLTVQSMGSLSLIGGTNLTVKCINVTKTTKGFAINVSSPSRLNITGCDFW